MASQTTSPAANAELVRAGFRAFNVGDAHGCMALAAPDLVTHPAPPAQLTTLGGGHEVDFAAIAESDWVRWESRLVIRSDRRYGSGVVDCRGLVPTRTRS